MLRRGKATTVRWEWLLSNVDEVPSPPPVGPVLRWRAVTHTARGLRVLNKNGWGPAHRYLQELRPASYGYSQLAPGTAIRLARREVFYSGLVLRLLKPDALCLPRSFALAVYLSTLGLPVNVTVALAIIHGDHRFRFHSWTELYGEVLNDYPETPLGFRVLQRVRSRHLDTTGTGAPLEASGLSRRDLDTGPGKFGVE